MKRLRPPPTSSAPPTRAELEGWVAALGQAAEEAEQRSLPTFRARRRPPRTPTSSALPLPAPDFERAPRPPSSASPAKPNDTGTPPDAASTAPDAASAPPATAPTWEAEDRSAAVQPSIAGVPARHVPPPEPAPRPLPAGFRVPDVPGFDVPVSCAQAEAVEEAAWGARGPMSDLTAALHRWRWRHHPRARRVPRAVRIHVAWKYGLSYRTVDAMSRRIEAAIPPEATAAGKKRIQAERGRSSGAVRRAKCRERDLMADAAVRRGMPVREAAAALRCSPSSVVGAAARLQAGEVEDRDWGAARRERKRAVRKFWRRHYGHEHDGAAAPCRCHDGARRHKEQRRRAGSPAAAVPDVERTAAELRISRAERARFHRQTNGENRSDRRALSQRDPETHAGMAGADAPRSSAGGGRRESGDPPPHRETEQLLVNPAAEFARVRARVAANLRRLRSAGSRRQVSVPPPAPERPRLDPATEAARQRCLDVLDRIGARVKADRDRERRRRKSADRTGRG